MSEPDDKSDNDRAEYARWLQGYRGDDLATKEEKEEVEECPECSNMSPCCSFGDEDPDPLKSRISELERERDGWRADAEREAGNVAYWKGVLAEVEAEAAVMREALEGYMRDPGLKRVAAALAPNAGRALLDEVTAHRARATGFCSAHQVASDPWCLLCFPAGATEVALLREVVRLARQMRGRDAAVDAALAAVGGPDVSALHDAAGWRVVTMHDLDRALARLDAMKGEKP